MSRKTDWLFDPSACELLGPWFCEDLNFWALGHLDRSTFEQVWTRESLGPWNVGFIYPWSIGRVALCTSAHVNMLTFGFWTLGRLNPWTTEPVDLCRP